MTGDINLCEYEHYPNWTFAVYFSYFGPILHYFAIALDIFDLSMTVFDRHYLTKAADYYPVLILLSQYIEILPHEKHTDQNDINESHE